LHGAAGAVWRVARIRSSPIGRNPFDAPDHPLAKYLCLTAALVVIVLELSLTRRAARQPILDAARRASPRKDG